jgi:Na+/melibiose symporter-like transporter
MAWANEITTNTDEKNFLFGIWSIAISLGGILFYALPLLPFLVTTEINPEVLKIAFWAGLAVFMPCLFWVLYRVPNGRASKVESVSTLTATSVSCQPPSFAIQLSTTAKSIIRNQSFLLYCLIVAACYAALGMWTSLLFIYIDGYLKLGEEFAGLSLAVSLFGIACIAFWYRISKRISKRKMWMLSVALNSLALIFFSLLTVGKMNLVAYVAVVYLFLTFSNGAMFIITPILCDIVDYGRWRETIDRGGLYFALNALLQKAQIAVGGALGLAILGWAEFDINAAQQTELAITSIKASVSWLPAILYLLAFALASKLPLTERRMQIIRRRLAARDLRLAG